MFVARSCFFVFFCILGVFLADSCSFFFWRCWGFIGAALEVYWVFLFLFFCCWLCPFGFVFFGCLLVAFCSVGAPPERRQRFFSAASWSFWGAIFFFLPVWRFMVAHLVFFDSVGASSCAQRRFFGLFVGWPPSSYHQGTADTAAAIKSVVAQVSRCAA